MQRPWAESPPTMPWDPSGTSDNGEQRKGDTEKRGRGDQSWADSGRGSEPERRYRLGLHFVNDCLRWIAPHAHYLWPKQSTDTN